MYYFYSKNEGISRNRQNLQPLKARSLFFICLILCIYHSQFLFAADALLFSFSIDPTVPQSFWAIMIGLGINWSGTVCINQSVNQRYLACKSVKDARM